MLLLANPFGGVTAAVHKLLIHLDKTKTGIDSTVYGENSTRSFYGHHAAAISIACVTGDAEAVIHGVSRLEFKMATAAA